MNLKPLTLVALAALCALPAVAAEDDSGPDLTVNVDPDSIECQTTRIELELGPAFSPEAEAVVDDCEASVSYEGHDYRARCAPHSTHDPLFVAYSGPDVTLDRYCGVTVDV
jgi:hypothetical protein